VSDAVESIEKNKEQEVTENSIQTTEEKSQKTISDGESSIQTTEEK
jgi:hypothetical protein